MVPKFYTCVNNIQIIKISILNWYCNNFTLMYLMILYYHFLFICQFNLGGFLFSTFFHAFNCFINRKIYTNIETILWIRSQPTTYYCFNVFTYTLFHAHSLSLFPGLFLVCFSYIVFLRLGFRFQKN